ncbi:60s ribosomal protein l19 [Colletotrichum tabaci]|uniref:60s ribosomal protein l19 n=1 Tax=Colletotrichum tabaci TaxID=1209068 RepID=A0AAV9TKS8_9PEZI
MSSSSTALFCYSTRLLNFFGNWLFFSDKFFGNSQLLYNRAQLFCFLRGQPIFNNNLSKPSLFHQPDISELLCYSNYQLYCHHLWNLFNIRCQHVLAANQFLQLHNIFTAPQCGVTLPGTCADLPNTNGLLPLVGVTASCLLDLGPFGVGPVATCLLNIDLLDPRGQPIADCLLRTLRGSCPGALPQPCIDLQLVNGLDLLVDLPACVAALGPYSSGATAVCLAVNSITSATTGLSIFGCLQGSFQPPPTVVTVTDPALCPPAPTPTRCATPSLPEQCLSLSTVNGLDLLVDIPACVQALGLYAVGDVATCLVTSLIDTLTSGQSIVNCLQGSLGSRCVTSLPQVCLDLSVSNDAVTANLCLSLLGPLSLGVAGSCFTSGLTSGDAIVQCLNNVLFP